MSNGRLDYRRGKKVNDGKDTVVIVWVLTTCIFL